MKMNGVSGTEKTDTLFFQAVDRALSNPKTESFQNVLKTSRAEETAKKESSYSLEVKDTQSKEEPGQTQKQLKTASSKPEEQQVSESGKQDTSQYQDISQNQDISQEQDASLKITGENVEENLIPELPDVNVKTDEEGKEASIPMEIITIVSITVRQIVIEGMNITEEQFEEALKACGLDELQLFEPQNLKEFMLSMTDTKDITEFLTDESLIKTYQMVENALSELDLDEFGIQKDQLMEYMKAAQNAILKQDVANTETMKLNEKYVSTENPTESKTAQENDPLAEKLVVEDSRMDVKTTKQMNQSQDGTEQNPDSDDSSESILHREIKEHSKEVPNVTEHFARKLTEHSTTVTRTDTQTVVMYRQIITQIVEQVKVIIKPDQTSMSMQLQPENLGRLLFHVTEKQGAVTAQFVVENEMAREAIEANMDVLKQTLQEQGTKVQSVEVTVSEFSLKERGMQQEAEKREEEKKEDSKQSGKRQFRLDELEESEELSSEEEAIANAMLQSGSTVEFRA